mmetsp:Transcript_144562/g.366945  ORF Transcript_144562/g.366945 Transcript_144562/m.366945 type:complete len:327 (+) Transcript_144562:1390-2370(+)
MKVMDDKGNVSSVAVSSGEVVACLGLPPPPGGWYGPFGFFRLVSYAFVGVAGLGVLFALSSLVCLDFFGFLAAALLTVAALVSAAASYAHEGLANEVTEMAKQNDQFAQKNDKLTEQVKELGGVADKLQSIEKDLGVNMDQLKATLEAMHRQTSIQQLATMLSAFCDADRDGDKNQRLTNSEVSDFFDSSDAVLRGACPTFDFEALKQLALTVGIGLYAMRFMVNALIASGDDNPHKSTAELSLIMFCFDPEHHLESCLADLRLVLTDTSEEELRSILQEKKDKFAIAAENGRIPCKDLHDISHRVMTFDATGAKSPSASRSPKSP